MDDPSRTVRQPWHEALHQLHRAQERLEEAAREACADDDVFLYAHDYELTKRKE